MCSSTVLPVFLFYRHSKVFYRRYDSGSVFKMTVDVVRSWRFYFTQYYEINMKFFKSFMDNYMPILVYFPFKWKLHVHGIQSLETGFIFFFLADTNWNWQERKCTSVGVCNLFATARRNLTYTYTQTSVRSPCAPRIKAF